MNDTVAGLKKQRHPYETLSVLYILIQGANQYTENK